MPSPGLSPSTGPSTSGEAASRIRIDLRSGCIADLEGGLLGPPEEILGRPVAELWQPAEGRAIARRLDDVVLLGEDRLAAVAVRRDRKPIWVEITARYCHLPSESIELRLERLPGPDPASREPDLNGAAQAAEDARPSRHPEAVVIEALEVAGVAALRLDAEARVEALTSAAERLLGRPADLLLGQSLDRLFRFSPQAAAALAEARANGRPQSVLAEPPDGGAGMAMDWLAGSAAGSGHAILTASRPSSAESENLRFRAQLASAVAHDVRDSIAAVFCGLRSLASDLPQDSPLQTIVAQALEESERASRITEDVLSVSRPGDLMRVQLDVDTVVMEAMGRHRKRAAASHIEIQSDLQSGCQVLADLASLERVIGNLVENALDATPRGGQLRIRSRPESRGRPGVCITVADSGVGIKEETKEHVFEPFVTDKHDGTGLGLAITKRVVLDHEGQIHFDSQEGEGTTFHVWLPLFDATSR